MNNLFTGNIMQRTNYETDAQGFTCTFEPRCFTLKAGVILYQTKNGGYVEFSDLTKKSDYEEVDMLNFSDHHETTSSEIVVMPGVALSRVGERTVSSGSSGTLGWFVDLESLQPYQEPQIEDGSVKKIR
jgi:hypothetical protein